MAEDRLHVVFGTGQVGNALAAHLAGLGLAVRAVSRHRPAALAGVDWRAADAADPEAAADAAKGASVIYQCVNAPYTQWPERFPPLQRGVLAAAERNGALLVSLENLYGYGPTGGKPMTEDLPLAATTVKGRTRAAMTAELLAAADAGRVRVAIGRASDFFGPGVTQGSTLGERVFGNALAAGAPTSSATRTWPTPTATFPTSPPPGHPGHRYPRGRPGVASARPGDRHDPGAPGPGRRPGRASCRRPVGAQAGRAGPGTGQPDAAGAGRDVVSVRRAVRPGHQQVPGRVRGGRHAAEGRHRRDRGLVPDAAEHAMTPDRGR